MGIGIDRRVFVDQHKKVGNHPIVTRRGKNASRQLHGARGRLPGELGKQAVERGRVVACTELVRNAGKIRKEP